MAFFDADLDRASAAPAYVIADASVPVALVEGTTLAGNADCIARVDLAVEAGRIAAIAPAGALAGDGRPRVALDRGMILPLFVDMHTHLDKGTSGRAGPTRTGAS